MWFVIQCVHCTGHWPLGLSVLLPTPELQLQVSLTERVPLNSRLASIALTDCFFNVDKKDDLSASTCVAERVIDTKHFLWCRSSLKVELTPVNVRCHQSAIYPDLIDSTRAPQ